MGKTPGFSCTEQSRKFECRCVSYDSLMLNTVILVMFFFLGWKILEISGQCKSLNSCYSQLEKNLADSFRCDGRGFLNGYLADSKGLIMRNHDGTRASDKGREGSSGNGSSMRNNSFVSCSCEDNNSFVSCSCEGRCRDGNTGIRMQDLIDDNHDEADLNKEISADVRIADIEVHENPEDEQDLDSAALRRAIKVEQGYRAAAYLELEKERKATASAAHEAMVMILRLQNEKHLIELQGQQQQRESQQRQLYDEEVIQSLREIISEQELEKEALEDQLMKMRRKVYSAKPADDVDQGNRNMSSPSSPIPENSISDHVSGFVKDAEAHQASIQQHRIDRVPLADDESCTGQGQQQQRESQQRQLYDEEVIQSLREIISEQELEKEALEDQLMKMRRKVYSAKSADDVDQGNRNMSSPSSPIPENSISDHVSGFMKDAEAHQASIQQHRIGRVPLADDESCTEEQGQEANFLLEEPIIP